MSYDYGINFDFLNPVTYYADELLVCKPVEPLDDKKTIIFEQRPSVDNIATRLNRTAHQFTVNLSGDLEVRFLSGDTLSYFSRLSGVSVEDLKRLNHISDVKKIPVGFLLIIPIESSPKIVVPQKPMASAQLPPASLTQERSDDILEIISVLGSALTDTDYLLAVLKQGDEGLEVMYDIVVGHWESTLLILVVMFTLAALAAGTGPLAPLAAVAMSGVLWGGALYSGYLALKGLHAGYLLYRKNPTGNAWTKPVTEEFWVGMDSIILGLVGMVGPRAAGATMNRAGLSGLTESVSTFFAGNKVAQKLLPAVLFLIHSGDEIVAGRALYHKLTEVEGVSP